MSKHHYTRVPNGGVERLAEPHLTNPDSFYDLLNLRPTVGALRQFAPVVSKVTLSALASETSSTVRFVDLIRTNTAALRYLVVNEQTARYVVPTSVATQTLVPAITQTKIPNNTTVYGQLLLYGFNTTDFSVSGDYIEVEIQSATTFRWNRNGGAWTSGVTVARNLAIGANGLKLDFLESTGYTAADLWRWTRTETIPYSSSIASTKNFSYSGAPYLTDVYLGGIGRNVMRVRDDFITSVGYNRVYGKHVAVFQNHLVVSHYATAAHSAGAPSDPYAAATTPFVVGWSDLNNPDAFFATSVNEADTYSIPYNTCPEDINYGITGLGLLGPTLWLHTAAGMSSMDYVGLPNVMQILPRYNVGSIYHNGLVVTPNGHYFIGQDGFYFFDGNPPRQIGTTIYAKFFSEVIQLDPTDDNSESVLGYYDMFRQEVSWIYWLSTGQCRQIVYSERFNRWTFRNLPYETANKPRAIGRVYNSATRLLYGGVAKVNFDYDSTESTSAILLDDQASAGYTQPFAETNDLFYRDLYLVKEAESFYLDAAWDSGVTGLQLSHSLRNLISTTPAFTALTDLWTPAIIEGRLSLPHGSGRVFRFRFKFSGTKPVGCVLNAWGDVNYGENQGVKR